MASKNCESRLILFDLGSQTLKLLHAAERFWFQECILDSSVIPETVSLELFVLVQNRDAFAV